MGGGIMSSTLLDRPAGPPDAAPTPAPAATTTGKPPAPPMGGIDHAAVAALLAVTLAGAFGFSRVFIGWSFFGPLLLAAVASHAVAYGCRRVRWPLPIAFLVSLAGGALVLGHALYSKTMRYGLPSSSTWHVFYIELRDSAKGFGTAVPPVVATGGFVAASAVAVWLTAFAADTFAFRFRSTVESIIPASVLFIFVAAVSSKNHRLLTASLFVLTSLAAIAILRTMRTAAGGGWLTGHRRGAAIALAKTGLIIAGVAALIGAMLGPNVPGAKSKALVDTKNTGNDTKYVVSPLVDIKKRLSSRSDVELFSVTGPRAYWRVTSLQNFDGQRWTSDLKQGKAKDSLAAPPPGLSVTKATATMKIAALGDVWMPAPYLPTAIDSVSMKATPKFDRNTATLLVPGELHKGDTYTVTAAIPSVTADMARDASVRPAKIDAQYLELPRSFPSGMKLLAADITKGAETPFDQMIALQTYFQGFTYSLAAPAGEGNSEMEAFIVSKAGYCEQFSGTFAAFARSLGVPARVAVGFTPGVFSNGKYSVQARHAHAWPEVYFDGVGWLAFEPTPGRGNPQAEPYTGIADAQDGEAATPRPEPTISPTTTVRLPSDTRVPTPTTSRPDIPGGAAIPKKPNNTGRNLGIAGLIALVLIGYPLLVRFLGRRRWDRRRNRANGANERVLVAWNRTADALTKSGHPPRPYETPAEYARRTTDALPIGREQMYALAGHVTNALYSPDDASTDVVTESETVPSRVSRSLDTLAGRRTKLGRMVNPMPLLRPLPGDTRKKGRRWELS
jgi:transglutaminase-like putative cysteine protease